MFHPAGDLLVTVGIILFFFIILIYLYTIPLKISLVASRSPSMQYVKSVVGYGPLSLAVLYDGMLTGEIQISERHMFSFPLLMTDEEEKERDEKSHDYDIASGLQLFRIIVNGFKRIIRHFKIDTFFCHARVGYGDPYTTGIFYGYIQAIIPFFPTNTDICIIPDFDKPALEGEIRLVALITYPFSLLVCLCRIIIPEVMKNPGLMGGKN